MADTMHAEWRKPDRSNARGGDAAMAEAFTMRAREAAKDRQTEAINRAPSPWMDACTCYDAIRELERDLGIAPAVLP